MNDLKRSHEPVDGFFFLLVVDVPSAIVDDLQIEVDQEQSSRTQDSKGFRQGPLRIHVVNDVDHIEGVDEVVSERKSLDVSSLEPGIGVVEFRDPNFLLGFVDPDYIQAEVEEKGGVTTRATPEIQDGPVAVAQGFCEPPHVGRRMTIPVTTLSVFQIK
ncbi:MAG: hypothetical protein WEC84_00635 [Candidatus Andersenbacteria bacterium]